MENWMGTWMENMMGIGWKKGQEMRCKIGYKFWQKNWKEKLTEKSLAYHMGNRTKSCTESCRRIVWGIGWEKRQKVRQIIGCKTWMVVDAKLENIMENKW